ncbi:hypothetical protein VUR80DRAFT_5401 [Thermomyces stellatus]
MTLKASTLPRLACKGNHESTIRSKSLGFPNKMIPGISPRFYCQVTSMTLILLTSPWFTDCALLAAAFLPKRLHLYIPVKTPRSISSLQ